MLTDETEPRLFPGNWGMLCPGNGMHKDLYGNTIECLCDECDYLLCCATPPSEMDCQTCLVIHCPKNRLNTP